ncbi:hypothetical protein MKJ04_09295 [Pontibacter sp. E15-1]|uniref:hypothetical protein n=1 Tax=Pontibacter sp. E15-1 TaxID=2919918 RepID=UPI001F4FC57D|nr:hypothetical protein [Pontibacter sp. E15-1]MCJ8165037.1 hypothetical protein [Pontibacter sp. E15-1]
MQQNNDENTWDDEKYRLLNAHFRQQINQLLQSDPFLANAATSGHQIQLQDIVYRMSVRDQELWAEFLKLDRMKLDMDIKAHLEGSGKPYHPRTRFGDHAGKEGDVDEPW